MKDLFDGNKPLVCFFDSGIGGLTLLRESIKRRADVRYAYFADNYNVPYGKYSHGELLELIGGIFDIISSYNPTAAVIACNTVTAHCVTYLRGKYSFPIIGIQPAVKPAIKAVKNCLVLATPATVNSSSLNDLLTHFGGSDVKAVACPSLAAYIEQNAPYFDEEKVFGFLPDIQTDGVVLGCTHYIYVKQIVSKFYGGCPVFDGVEGTVNRLFSVLGNNVGSPCEDNVVNQSLKDVIFIGGDTKKNEKILNFLI